MTKVGASFREQVAMASVEAACLEDDGHGRTASARFPLGRWGRFFYPFADQAGTALIRPTSPFRRGHAERLVYQRCDHIHTAAICRYDYGY